MRVARLAGLDGFRVQGRSGAAAEDRRGRLKWPFVDARRRRHFLKREGSEFDGTRSCSVRRLRLYAAIGMGHIVEAMKKAIKRLLPSRLVRRIRDTLHQSRVVAHRLRWSAFAYREAAIGVGTFGGYDVAYRIGSVDAAVLGHSFDKDIFLSAIPEYSLPADAVVLDVGAHIGTFSLLASKKAPQGCVFAIEASRDTFNLLKTNVSMNGLRNVIVDHLALTDRIGMVSLHHDPDGNYGHSITKQLSS